MIYKINLKRINPSLNCEDILAKTFFKILDTGDNSLLGNGKKPIFDKFFLIDIFDKIMSEYQGLLKNNNYTNYLDEVNHDLSKKIRLSGVVACYHLLKLDKELAIKELQYWGINVKDNSLNDLKYVESMIKQQVTNIKIEAIQNKNQKKEKTNYDKIIAKIEEGLDRNIQADELTVSRMCAYIESIEDKKQIQEKLASHGRGY